MQIFKNSILQGEIKSSRFFQRTQTGFRLWVRLVGVNVEAGEIITVRPVFNPVVDVEFIGPGALIQIGWKRPAWLIVFNRLHFHIERLNDRAFYFVEGEESDYP